MNPEDLIGHQQGHFVIQAFLGKETRSFKSRDVTDYRYQCMCECGSSFEATRRSIISKDVASCGCQRWHSGSQNGKWSGHGQISGSHWRTIQKHASERGRLFEISINQAWDKYLQQEGKCALSGIILVMGQPEIRKTNTASLDRIDSNQGYNPSNIQWVHKDINYMKSNMTDSQFIQWCVAVAQHRAGEEPMPAPEADIFRIR